ncbi:hypothetical protein M5K25_013341 [Dendrobium thyrsiflorum]|uniref:DUF4283 domain-containing protein n=1 Tax=Dendrobium thyrsiflorum TaxID=117978 RepID=A0ABD0UZV9_DENTH
MAGSKLVDVGFLAGNSSSKSFHDALSGSFSSFPDLKISTHRGLPSLWISEAEVLSLALPFEFSLVGKFPSNRPSLEAIRKFFFNLKLIGDFSVTVLNMKNVLIKLANDLDYCRVFAHRSYFINNCYMRLIKWSPSFDVDVESPVVPIWVSFPNLRPHLFSPRILQGLGTIFGRPLKIDQATSVGSRPSVARILVELDVSKQHSDKVWVGPDNLGYVQSAVLENVPSYCLHCKALGHSNADCLVLHPHLALTDIVPKSAVKPVVVPIIPEVVVVDSAVQVPMGSNVQLDEVLASDAQVDVQANVDGLDPPAVTLEGVSISVDCLNLNVPGPVVGVDDAATPEEDCRNGTMVTWPLSDGDDPLSKSFENPIFTVPISIVSKDVMNSHLSRDSEVVHVDWLHDENSPDDDSLYEDDSTSRDNFDLSILQIVGVDNMSIKRKKRKSKKKLG